MSNFLLILIPVGFVVALWTLFFSIMPTSNVVVYDCRLVEISPDFPIDVKNKCRKLNSGRI